MEFLSSPTILQSGGTAKTRMIEGFGLFPFIAFPTGVSEAKVWITVEDFSRVCSKPVVALDGTRRQVG